MVKACIHKFKHFITYLKRQSHIYAIKCHTYVKVFTVYDMSLHIERVVDYYDVQHDVLHNATSE